MKEALLLKLLGRGAEVVTMGTAQHVPAFRRGKR